MVNVWMPAGFSNLEKEIENLIPTETIKKKTESSYENGCVKAVKDRITLSSVISPYVSWDNKRSSPRQGSYWALCPFHTESTASFHVQDDKQTYYCFSCHAKGDAITFLQEREKFTFNEALQKLADLCGYSLRKKDHPYVKSKDKEVLQLAQSEFRKALFSDAGIEAIKYLENRGLTVDDIKQFGIGFSPSDRNFLKRVIVSSNYSEKDGIAAGVLLEYGTPVSVIDRFSDRITFPIYDVTGKLVSFAGRALNKDVKAKYINGKGTELFEKGKVLYNLNQARTHAKDTNNIYVCEGYMDVIACARAGFKDVVAPMGTALTTEHIELLWRYVDEPTIVFDGDKAGTNAANKAADTVLPILRSGKSLRFVFLPEGQDPDDIVLKHGVEKLAECLNKVVPLWSVLFQRHVLNMPTNTPERMAKAKDNLLKDINKIEDLEVRQQYTTFMLNKVTNFNSKHTTTEILYKLDPVEIEEMFLDVCEINPYVNKTDNFLEALGVYLNKYGVIK